MESGVRRTPPDGGAGHTDDLEESQAKDRADAAAPFSFVRKLMRRYDESMGTQRAISVYADTSVFGGVFDDEFSEASRTFVDAVVAGRFTLVTSELVRQEIAAAPEGIRELFDDLLPGAHIALVSDEALRLQQAYLSAAIVSERFATDALHVALATVSETSMIVSRNFRHIVHFQKIPKYNAVNKLHSYSDIAIYSPLEVIEREDEDI